MRRTQKPTFVQRWAPGMGALLVGGALCSVFNNANWNLKEQVGGFFFAALSAIFVYWGIFKLSR